MFSEEEEPILAEAIRRVSRELDGLKDQKFTDSDAVSRHVVQALGRYWRHEIGRRPKILPVVIEV